MKPGKGARSHVAQVLQYNWWRVKASMQH
jgi:hypothetical protein